jgi:hypothetical protein
LIALIVTLLAAITLVACGDDKSKPLTVPEYLQSLQIVLDETYEDTAFLKSEENREIWLNDLEGTRELLSQSIPVSETTAEKLNRLTPPEALAVPHAKLVASFNVILDGNEQMQGRLAELSTNEELEAFEANELPLPGTPQAAVEFREACQALQDFGSQQGTAVDLHCSDL